jgi:hypothetical protein
VCQNNRKLYLTGFAAHVVHKGIETVKNTPLMTLVLLGQGAMYLTTGIWPLISRRTFEKVTGPKTDWWLVKTVGIIITVVGAVLTMAGLRGRTPTELPVLAVGSAAGLTAIDMGYVANNRISPVYLLDAVAEMGLIALWTIALARKGDD